MEKNIFNDGEIVHTFKIPKEKQEWIYKKKKWGERVLADYVSQFFGDRARWNVSQSRSHNGSLTGTQVVIQSGDVRTTFMLIEPRGRYRQEIHISKIVEDADGGSFLDVMDYQFDSSRKESFESPFAALAGIKEKLPRGRRSLEW